MHRRSAFVTGSAAGKRAGRPGLADGTLMLCVKGRRVLVSDVAIGFIVPRTRSGNRLTIVHPDDEASVIGTLAEWRERGRYDLEYRFVRPDGSVRWVRDRGFPAPRQRGQPRQVIGIASDITPQRQREAALAHLESRARSQLAELSAIYETAPLGICVIDRHHRYVRINPRLAEMNGFPPEAHIGRTMREIVPDVANVTEPIVDRVLATGEAERHEVRGRTNASAGGDRVWQSYWYPYKDESGRATAVNVIVEEITERKAAEAQRELLLRELNHRVKNTLSVVQSIAEQTAMAAPTPTAFNAIFTTRLRALSRAHNLLTRDGWQGASLAEVIEQMLAPFRPAAGDGAIGNRIAIAGPDMRIRADVAITLSMAMHELATNAAKHGSLSTADGRLAATWDLVDGEGGVGDGGAAPRVEIRWVESGGPAVAQPLRRGFGTRLIEFGLAMQFNADVRLHFAPTGVECLIRLPTDRVLAG